MTDKEKKYIEDKEDAKRGFPRFREYIDGLSFKKKVIEYVSVSKDNHASEKHDIIYNSFSFAEKNKFNDKYSDIITTIHKIYNLIVNDVRLMYNVREQVEANLREVFVHERNVEWLNELIKEIEKTSSDRQGKDEELLSILKKTKSYKTPVKALKTTINESTGFFELDSSGFDCRITSDIQTIVVSMQCIKAFLLSVRSFLKEHNAKDLLPSYIKDIELEVEGFDVVNVTFSSRRGNIIRKKSKKSRTPDESYILEEIERNEKKGYTFPDYATITPVECHINECERIWKKIITE